MQIDLLLSEAQKLNITQQLNARYNEPYSKPKKPHAVDRPTTATRLPASPSIISRRTSFDSPYLSKSLDLSALRSRELERQRFVLKSSRFN